MLQVVLDSGGCLLVKQFVYVSGGCLLVGGGSSVDFVVDVLFYVVLVNVFKVVVGKLLVVVVVVMELVGMFLGVFEVGVVMEDVLVLGEEVVLVVFDQWVEVWWSKDVDVYLVVYGEGFVLVNGVICDEWVKFCCQWILDKWEIWFELCDIEF